MEYRNITNDERGTTMTILQSYEEEVNRILDRYGYGVRPSWVSEELEYLYRRIRQIRLEEGNKNE